MVTANDPKSGAGNQMTPYRPEQFVHREPPARTSYLPIIDFKGPKAHPIRGVTSQCTVIFRC
jgi:hypothetical protein